MAVRAVQAAGVGDDAGAVQPARQHEVARCGRAGLEQACPLRSSIATPGAARSSAPFVMRERLRASATPTSTPVKRPPASRVGTADDDHRARASGREVTASLTYGSPVAMTFQKYERSERFVLPRDRAICV